MLKTEVKELSFEGFSSSKNHPDLPKEYSDELFVVLSKGSYKCGKMYPVWFGHNFENRQFDIPGKNYSDTQKVWKVLSSAGLKDGEAILLCAGINPVELSVSLELDFANYKKKLSLKGYPENRIPRDTPLEAFIYRPTVEIMREPYSEGEDEDIY